MKLIQRPKRRELATFDDEVDRFFEDFFERRNSPFVDKLPEVFQSAVAPACDLSENDKAYTYHIALPGLEEKDIAVELKRNALVISAERRWEDRQKEDSYRRVETQFGSFYRVLAIPEDVDVDGHTLEAKYKNGLLEIVLPKSEPSPTRRIPIK